MSAVELRVIFRENLANKQKEVEEKMKEIMESKREMEENGEETIELDEEANRLNEELKDMKEEGFKSEIVQVVMGVDTMGLEEGISEEQLKGVEDMGLLLQETFNKKE